MTRVRLRADNGYEFLVFVTLPTDTDEVRVRWHLPDVWRCDAHPAERHGTCAHAYAIKQAGIYEFETAAEIADPADLDEGENQ